MKEETRKKSLTEGTEHTKFQNLCNEAKAVLWLRFIELNAYVNKIGIKSMIYASILRN